MGRYDDQITSATTGWQNTQDWYTNNIGNVGAGLSIVNGLFNQPKTYNVNGALSNSFKNGIENELFSGKYGFLGQVGGAAYALADKIGLMSGASEGLGTKHDIINGIASVLPLSSLFGKKVDKYTQSQISKQYANEYADFQGVADKAAKNSGLKLVSGAGLANNISHEADRQDNTVQYIDYNNQINNDRQQTMTSLYGNRNNVNTLGGYQQTYTRAGKEGLKFAKTVINTYKIGGGFNKFTPIQTNYTELPNIETQYFKKPMEIKDRKAQESIDRLIDLFTQHNPESSAVPPIVPPSVVSPNVEASVTVSTIPEISTEKPSNEQQNTKQESTQKSKQKPIQKAETEIQTDFHPNLNLEGVPEKQPKKVSSTESNIIDLDFSNLSGGLLTNGSFILQKLKDIGGSVQNGILTLSPKYSKILEDKVALQDLAEMGNALGFNKVAFKKEGGTFNVIPEGALHKNKHHMEDAEGLTKKGIPVVTEEGGELVQQAEIEKNEIIFRLEVTNKLEELLKKYSESKDDSLAIEAGKLLTDEIMHNTVDNTGLIKEC